MLDSSSVPRATQNRFEGPALEAAFGLVVPEMTDRDHRIVRRWQRTPLVRERRFYADTKIFDPNFARIPASCYISGYFQDHRYFADAAETVRSDFRPVSTTAERPDLLAAMTQTVPVAVHVRRGDYLTSSSLMIQEAGYYERAMQQLRSSLPGEPLRFYVFSDDSAWARAHLGMLPDLYFVDSTGHPSWSDLQMMMQCRHFIIANSSFSWWAAWLGSEPGSIVHYPERWLVDERLNADRRRGMPSGWRALA